MTVFPDEKLRNEFKRVLATWKGGLFSESTWKGLQDVVDRCEPKSKREIDWPEKEQQKYISDSERSFVKNMRPIGERDTSRDIGSNPVYTVPPSPFYGYSSMPPSSAYPYAEGGFPVYPPNPVLLAEPYLSYTQPHLSYPTSIQSWHPPPPISSLSLPADLATLQASAIPAKISTEHSYVHTEFPLGTPSPVESSDILMHLMMVLKRLGLLNISNHLEKLTTPLRDEEAISLLYERLPLQCKMCALRFFDTEEGKQAIAEHLDWHYRRNKRLREQLKRPTSRGWYLSDKVSNG